MPGTPVPATASPAPAAPWDLAQVCRVLDAARDDCWEHPGRALTDAVRCQEVARTLASDALRARAIAVQATVTLNRGDLRGAFVLAAAAEDHAERGGAQAAHLEVAALKAQLSFSSGSYAEALRYAHASIEIADRLGDPRLRMFARRAACPVLGNLEAPLWGDELAELLRLSEETGDRWQEAISRNDLGGLLTERGDLVGAAHQLELGLALAAGLAPHNRVALTVLHATRADLRLVAGDPAAALADAERAQQELDATQEPSPYLFGMTAGLEVRALIALSRAEEAQRCGERALERLGDRVPQARGMILVSVAAALRDAGRVEAAYDAIVRGVELERQAAQELNELVLGFERASLETKAARHEADALAVKNRELEEVLDRLARTHAALEGRTAELELVEAQLREQADRDPLTDLHNRRYLTSALERTAAEARGLGVAIIDLDDFKAINDAHGHAVGDRVLVRIGVMLRAAVRTDDVVARTGGEEFVLLLPGADADAVLRVCERLLAALRAEPWERLGPGLRVTASVGVAVAAADAGAVDPEALMRTADARLYAAKRAGRDRVAAG